MSIDVFGRNLVQGEGNRGPPGIGYIFTHDGQYDMENKRLCNLAAPIQSNEAVNLEILNRTVEEESERLRGLIKRLKKEYYEFLKTIETFKDDIYRKLKDVTADIEVMRTPMSAIHESIRSKDFNE